jgi:hypothetical protein
VLIYAFLAACTIEVETEFLMKLLLVGAFCGLPMDCIYAGLSTSLVQNNHETYQAILMWLQVNSVHYSYEP